MTTTDMLAWLAGLSLLLQQVVFADAASVALLGLALALIGLPSLRSDRSRAAVLKRTPELLLTPLDRAWLGYHEYLSTDA